MVGNFEKIAIACGKNLPLKKQIEIQTVKPIIDKYQEIMAKSQTEKSQDEIMEMFKNYGQDTGLRMPFV